MAASDAALLQQMDDYILDGKYHEATDAYCRLVAAAPGQRGGDHHPRHDHRRAVPARAGAPQAPAQRRVSQRQLRPHHPRHPGRHAPAALALGAREVPHPGPGHLLRAAGARRVGAARVRVPRPLRPGAGEVRGGGAADQQAPALPLRGPGAAGRGLGGRALPADVRGHRGRRQGRRATGSSSAWPPSPSCATVCATSSCSRRSSTSRSSTRSAGSATSGTRPSAPARCSTSPTGWAGSTPTRSSTSACRTSATRRSSTRCTITRASCSASRSRASSTSFTRRTSRR